MIQIHDIPYLGLLREKVEGFEEGRLNLQDLVVGLDSILNGQPWKDEFRPFWRELERINTVTIAENKEIIDENSTQTINTSIDNIKKLIDFKIHNKIGEELKVQLAQGYDVLRIARWAYSFFLEYGDSIDSISDDVIYYLFLMEEGPGFEFTEPELKLLAEKLINDEDNPLQQIMDLKSKGLI